MLAYLTDTAPAPCPHSKPDRDQREWTVFRAQPAASPIRSPFGVTRGLYDLLGEGVRFGLEIDARGDLFG